MPAGRRCIRIGALSQANLLRLMMSGELSVEELAEATGMHRVTIYRYVKALHKQGVVHICAYRRDARGCATIRLFKLGAGEDARRGSSNRRRAIINRQAREAYARRVQAKRAAALAQGLAPSTNESE